MGKHTLRPLLIESSPGQNLRLNHYSFFSSTVTTAGSTRIKDELLRAAIIPGVAAKGLPDTQERAIGSDVDAERSENILRGADVEEVGFRLRGGGEMVEVEGCGAGEGCSEVVIVVCVLCEGCERRVSIG